MLPVFSPYHISPFLDKEKKVFSAVSTSCKFGKYLDTPAFIIISSLIDYVAFFRDVRRCQGRFVYIGLLIALAGRFSIVCEAATASGHRESRGDMNRKTMWLAVFLALVWIRPVVAGEQGRTLKDRIKSVSNKLYVKSGRLELTLLPMTSISLNDAFYQKFGGGLGIAYHFSESLSVGFSGTYNINVELSNASYYGRKDENTPSAGKRNFLIGLDLMWAPVYGKVNLASEWVMHFDTYLCGGLGAVGSLQVDDSTNFGFAASFGLGIRLFMTRMFAIRAELVDYMVFNDKVTFGSADFSKERSDFQHQLMFNLGLSMFFLDGDAED